MRKWLLSVFLILCGITVGAMDVEAGRLGGGRSVGAQRNVTAPPAAVPAKPAQQQQAAPQPQPSRWGAILGGLAIGGLLGYLFGGNGLLGLLLLGLLAFIVIAALRALVARRSQAIQLAGTNETIQVQQVPGGALTRVASVPAGFDAAGFLKAAKTNFLKLQMAHDAGRLDEIREFTTPEMFEALRGHLESGQDTDVASLDADLLEVATEQDQHWASVRFSGTLRESPGTAPVGFSEVWNLVKPVDGSSGWLLAGIQQMH